MTPPRAANNKQKKKISQRSLTSPVRTAGWQEEVPLWRSERRSSRDTTERSRQRQAEETITQRRLDQATAAAVGLYSSSTAFS